jgi:UPF0716 protein FxsA
MPALLVVAFVVVPLVETYVLIQVGQVIGVIPTIALLIVDSLVGAWLFRREGRRTWRAFRQALEERRMPAREVADGALVLVGGTLLLTPGFVTDVFGLLCVLPPSRAVLRRMLTGLVAARLGVPGMVAGAAARGMRRRTPSPYGDVVEGEVVDGPGQAEGPPPGGKRPLDGGMG